ncbi:MAG TPA: FtsX-like permease family protein [Gemmatimonadaceae bacterium]|jgi:ABC-type antimicrobial peptide transport system permease subunit
MTSEQRGIRAGVRRLFRLPIRRRDVAQADADEQLDSFLAERIEDLMRRGMSHVRTRGAAPALAPDVRRLMETLGPDLPYPDVTAFSTALEPQFRPWRLGAVMFGLFGAVAMVLAIVGLYGVLAFRVGQRTHEIGVRVALGAQRSDVHRLVLSQGLRLAAIGVGIGIVAAVAGGRGMGALLYGVSGSDPLVLTIASATLLVVSLLASHLPARRATRIDPLEALREL